MIKNYYNKDYIKKFMIPNPKFQWDRYFFLNALRCLT